MELGINGGRVGGRGDEVGGGGGRGADRMGGAASM